MKALSAMLPLMALLAGCPADETDTDPDSDTSADTDTDTDTEQAAIIGDWVSEGEDVSELLATFFNIVAIDATFNADGSYSVVSEDSGGAQVTYQGTYTVDLTTTPHGITLLQTVPTEVTSEGIWQVDGTTMTYEVAQTSPAVSGVTAPTPEAGFGSTGGATAGTNVQTFQVDDGM